MNANPPGASRRLAAHARNTDLQNTIRNSDIPPGQLEAALIAVLGLAVEPSTPWVSRRDLLAGAMFDAGRLYALADVWAVIVEQLDP